VTGIDADTVLHPSRFDDVLCLTLDCPPLNIIDSRVYTALYEAFGRAETNDDVVGVVLAAAGRLFSGGGNINELGQPVQSGEADILAVVDRISTFRKPVGIALHGKTIGASVIIALACDIRVGLADTTLILPEVHLGLVPRCGTTQRLLRLAGIPVTLDMVALGKPLEAPAALAAGILDQVVDRFEDRATAAVEMVRGLSRNTSLRPNIPERSIPALANGRTLEGLFSDYRERVRGLFQGRAVPSIAMELIHSSIACDFAEGVQLERQQYERLLHSDEAVMLRSRMLKPKPKSTLPREGKADSDAGV
jgi:enoyl-CoA hydratase/carnithine racemase